MFILYDPTKVTGNWNKAAHLLLKRIMDRLASTNSLWDLAQKDGLCCSGSILGNLEFGSFEPELVVGQTVIKFLMLSWGHGNSKCTWITQKNEEQGKRCQQGDREAVSSCVVRSRAMRDRLCSWESSNPVLGSAMILSTMPSKAEPSFPELFWRLASNLPTRQGHLEYVIGIQKWFSWVEPQTVTFQLKTKQKKIFR